MKDKTNPGFIAGSKRVREAVLHHVSELNLGTDARRLLIKEDRLKIASELRTWAEDLERDDPS